MSISLLNPAYLVHKIDYIYYKCEEEKDKKWKSGCLQLQIEEEKERFRQEELLILSNVRNIPASMLKSNERKIASYQ